MLGNTPVEINQFVGRDTDEERLTSALTSSRLSTLTGIGGVGKTRLAIHALHQMTDRHMAGLGEPRWVDLGAIPDARLLTAKVADTVGFSDHSADPRLDALCEWLSDKRLLLVLDSCEHLVPACQNLVSRLLAACPHLTILATSRQPLELREEVRITLEPLPCETEALDLFFARAEAVAPALKRRSATQVEDAAEICRLLDGIPLAIELASAQVMHRPLREIAARLGAHFGDLAAPAPVWPRRHQSLRTAIGWSHELCQPLERLLWARLSVFRGTFDEVSARAVCEGGPLSGDRVSTVLARLVEKSVVARATPGRYRLLDTVREYGSMWLGELGEDRSTADRHADYFLGLARSADTAWAGPDQVEWYQKIALEHTDLCAALDHLLANEPPRAVELAGLVGFFWSCCGHLPEARTYLEQALLVHAGSSPYHGRARWALGVVLVLQGEHDEAAKIGSRCARDAARAGNTEEGLAAAYLLGVTHLLQGEASRAQAVVEQAMRQAPGPAFASASMLRCHLVQVFALTGLGHLETATEYATALRADCLAHGECWTRAYADYQLALLSLARGRPARAAEHARAMLEGKRRLGDSFGIALGLDVLAAAAAARGDGETAALVSGGGHTYWRSVGHSQRGTPELRDLREECWQSARTMIGDEAFDEAFNRGAEESPGTVVTLAISGRLRSGG
ncbi:regulator [Streptomyces sp. NPDC046853]|uniref:ATP-binding protein n=1 Tax=Streptomyces sp. NPDC046853 TaxID=3154920 RepID=UPI0033C23319